MQDFVTDLFWCAAVALEEHLKVLSLLQAGSDGARHAQNGAKTGDGSESSGQGHWQAYFKQIER